MSPFLVPKLANHVADEKLHQGPLLSGSSVNILPETGQVKTGKRRSNVFLTNVKSLS